MDMMSAAAGGTAVGPAGSALPAALAGESAAVRRARAVLDGAADGPILILADEGLEPTAAARYVHTQTRRGRPFLAVDCTHADPAEVERRLLGGRPRGAGDLEVLGSAAALLSARGGTLFLERITDLPSSVQRRLARALRDGEVRTTRRDRIRVDTRVIASAPPTLSSEARAGRFSADLLRRFTAQQVTLPALRNRPEDLSAIVQRLAAEISAASGRPLPTFTQPALTVLAAFQWPGNIVELRSALERILRDTPGHTVRQEDVLPTVPVEAVAARTPLVSLREARRRFEREYIAAVLEQHQWRMSEAARTLGIERANLYRKIRQLGISRAAATPGRSR
jgi:DNA-binding NtrC family response regulator